MPGPGLRSMYMFVVSVLPASTTSVEAAGLS
jgi:hypothetical protein